MTTDLCAKGGIPALLDYINSHDLTIHDLRSIYTDPSVFCGTFRSNYDGDDVMGRTTCENRQEYFDFLKKIITECPDHPVDFERCYYAQKLYNAVHCNKDSVTGEVCSELIDLGEFIKPYSQWESYRCGTSCITEVDKVFREYSTFPGCSRDRRFEDHNNMQTSSCESNFMGKSNPIDSCGKKDYVDPGNKSSGNATSDATTLNGQVVLLSLIICLIFAFFK